MPIIITPILLTIISAIFIVVNFISYLTKGKVITRNTLWKIIQIWTAVVLPTLFLSFMDLSNKNDCCSDSAIFSPEHRIGIYSLIILYTIAFVINIFRTNILTPIAELFLNSFLILGLILNLIFCKHFTTIEEGYIWWLFGNIPIILLLLINLTENQKLLQSFIEENKYSSNTIIGKLCGSTLKLKPIFKYPILTILLVPIIIFLSILLILFGQKPDSIIKAFTDTYKHGFSQLDYMCDNVECGGHFLCSVGANGHRVIVNPIRYGERNGKKIICNRQLLISNAFEDLMQERFPLLHNFIRQKYNKVGNLIHRHYHVFNNKFISDLVYVLMKPLEIFFILTLYSFDKKPENRIAVQYLSNNDRQEIKRHTTLGFMQVGQK
jgi:hypothetical protein